jgi:elongation factor Ts
MEISAALVKELRERTGAGMMECKKALVDAAGDIEQAIDAMRKSGVAKAAKKAGRIAAEGIIALAQDPASGRVAMAEINSETDFVAKGDDFQAFAAAVTQCALNTSVTDLAEFMQLPIAPGQDTVEVTRQQLVAKIGENINVRRYTVINGSGKTLGCYMHGSKIGVVAVLTGAVPDLAKDVAMHIAASRPVCVNETDVPAELLAKEREIFSAQAAESGKPPAIVEKMVDGRVQKYIKEVALVGQPFVKDPETPVGKLVKDGGAVIESFVRYEVGEGIEKKSENFAEEVMAQVRGS